MSLEGLLDAFTHKEESVAVEELIPAETLVNICTDFMRVITSPSQVFLWPYQETLARRVFRSLIEEDMAEITALFSRQSGKTEVMADVAITCMVLFPALHKAMPWDPRFQKYSQGFWVGIYAPIDEQAGLCFMRASVRIGQHQLQPLLEHPELNAGILKNSGGRIVIENGSFMRAKTASPNAHVEGWTYHLLIMDESQDLDKLIVRKSLHPMLAQTAGTMVKIGTPENSRSDFFDAILRNIQRDKDSDSKHRRHFEFDCYVCAKHSKRYAKYVEEEKIRLGEHSMEFRMKYLLIWHFDTDLAFNDDELKWIQDTKRPFLHSWQSSPTVAGWDVAQEKNKSVVWVCAPDFSRPAHEFSVAPKKKGGAREDEHSKFLCYHKSFIACLEMEGTKLDGPPGKSQYDRVAAFCRRFNVQRLVIDATGMGNPVTQRMEMIMPDIEVVGVSWNSTVIKSFVYTFYTQEIAAKRVTYPASEAAQALPMWNRWHTEHKDLTRRWSGNYMLCEKPDENAEDDHPDAGALAVWGTKDPLGTQTADVEVEDLWRVSQSGSMLEEAANELQQQRVVGSTRANRYRRGRRT